MLGFLLASALASDVAEVGSVGEPLRVDGRLDEDAWAGAPGSGTFTRFQPVPGGEPPGRTEVRFLQDDRYLYVGVRVTDADYRLRARISQRESIDADDQIGLYLDTFDDGISGYIFYFNALGIQQDIRYNAGTWNLSWDTLLRSKGRVTDDGFELEVAIPWRSLKFAPGSDTWRVVVTRKIPREGAKYSWPALERNTPRVFEDAARLTGLRPPARGSGFELLPSVTAGRTWPTDGPLRPLDVVRPSFDARFGITPDVGVTATVNPDFSQVETDVSDVRLNARFAFQFPEQRPFFLDGVDLFQDGPGTLYTRTMNAPIYGVKVAGREGPWSVGALHVLDADPLPSFTEGSSPGFGEADVNGALASTTLIRARTDAFGLGLAGVTLGDKRLLGGASHQVVGTDLDVPLGDRWFGGGSLQHTVTGPDGDRRWGTEQRVNVRRASGIGTGGQIAVVHRSRDFRRELGYLSQADLTNVSASIDHTLTPRGVVDTFDPAAWIELNEEGNGDSYRIAGLGQVLVFGGVHTLYTRGWNQWFEERGVAVRGPGGLVGYSANLGRALDVGIEGSAARLVDYALLVPSFDTNSSLSATLRPTAGIRNDLSVTLNTHTPESLAQETRTLVRNRMNWQFTRELGARWVLDHTTGTGRDPRLFNALLLTWLRNPGTALWLGGSVTSEDGKGIVERTVFAKATLLVRP